MKIKIISLLLLMVLILNTVNIPFAYAGENITYYVDASGGNDENDGMSREYPWKTIDKVMSTALNAGDSVLFKRGEIWYNVSIGAKYPGTKDNRITYGAYGDGEEKPVLCGGSQLEDWQLHSGNIYYTKADPEEKIYMLLINGKKEAKKNSTVTAETVSELAENEYALIDGTLYYNASGEEAPGAGTVIVDRAKNLFSVSNASYVTIDGLKLCCAGGSAVQIAGNGKNLGFYAEVKNCSVENIVCAPVKNDSGNSAAVDAAVKLAYTGGCEVVNNELHNIYGDGILLWNTSNNTVSQNTVSDIYKGSNPYGDGIQVSGGGKSDNNRITKNYINVLGIDSGKGCIIYERGKGAYIADNICLYGSYGIEADSADCIVERNYCAYQSYSNWSSGIYSSDPGCSIDNMTIRNNIIYQTKPYGIFIENSNYQEPDKYYKNINIYNNTVVSCGQPFVCRMPYWGEIKNNIFYSNSLVNSVINIERPVANKTIAIESNILAAKAKRSLLSYGGQTFYDADTFFDITGIGADFYTQEPEFVDLENGDFRIYSNTVGAGKGRDIGITSDYFGNSVPMGDSFNIGAIEEIVQSDKPDKEEPENPYLEGTQRYSRDLLVYEGFEYDAGENTENLKNGKSSGWNGNWEYTGNTAASAKIGTASIPYNGTNHVGYRMILSGAGVNKASSVKRSINPDLFSQNGEYWFSFTYYAIASKEFYAYLGGEYDTLSNAALIGLKNTSPVEWYYARPDQKGSWLSSGKAKSEDKNSMFIAKITLSDNETRVSVWNNPKSLESEEAMGNADKSYTISQRINPKYFIASSNSNSSAYIDEIRIARTPEAASCATVASDTILRAYKTRFVSNRTEDGKISLGVEARIYNTVENADKNALLCIAIFGSEGMLKTAFKNVSLSEGDHICETLYTEIDGETAEQASYAKFMILDGKSLVPACEYILENFTGE